MYRLKTIFIFTLLLALLVTQRKVILSVFQPATAYAVGDLVVNWGVPSGQPLFTITNSYPGQAVSKTVTIKNNAVNARPLAIRGAVTNQTGNLSNALRVTISENGTDLYGGTTGTKTLSNFFAESVLPQFVPLGTINPSQTRTLLVTVTFDQQAGNNYQNKNLTFDIHLGIGFVIPEACQHITFSGDPIYGTSGNDRLTGTSRNDLIIGLEGNDTISAVSGDDCVIGGAGNDVIDGGSGNDVLSGNEGNDTIRGGSGNDTISGGEGNDVLSGESGEDTLTGDTGVDRTDGGSGKDTCSAETKVNCEK